ncbi:uncharacterized protein K441DRAFT_656405 [Cenococcum geophilum 1.58]|uniref:uncharacterized protein n=1 Tax=Cenococcum geophilum 1.58 TaxID=794803 RepID=UPI00358ED6A1
MPTESEIIEIRVQDALPRLHNAPFKRVYNRVNGIKSKMQRPGTAANDPTEQWGILPYNEYNFDESGFRIRIGGS